MTIDYGITGCFVRLTAALLMTLGANLPATASSVNLGLISFDILIPGDTGPGVNVFNVQNLTGPAFGLPPDFPVVASLVFTNSVLTLSNGGSPIVIELGDLTPGVVSPTTPVEFPDTDLFSSAVFTATLSDRSFLLNGGGSFTALSQEVIATIEPSSGSFLSPGLDFALISVEEVPEPGSLSLLTAGLCLSFILGMTRNLSLPWSPPSNCPQIQPRPAGRTVPLPNSEPRPEGSGPCRRDRKGSDNPPPTERTPDDPIRARMI